jgi:hypothetical protein
MIKNKVNNSLYIHILLYSTFFVYTLALSIDNTNIIAEDDNSNAKIENKTDEFLTKEEEFIPANISAPLVNGILNVIQYYLMSMDQGYNIDKKQMQSILDELNIIELQSLLMNLYNMIDHDKKQLDMTKFKGILFTDFKKLFVFALKLINKLEQLSDKKNNNKPTNNTLQSIENITSSDELLKTATQFIKEFEETFLGNNISINHQYVEIAEKVNLSITSLLFLIKTIMNNINKSKYINNGFFTSIFYPNKRTFNKKNKMILAYQNEVIITYLNTFIKDLQSYQLMLFELISLQGEQIPEIQLNNALTEIMKQVVQKMSFIKCFLNNKFSPLNSKFNNSTIKNEFLRIENESKKIFQNFAKDLKLNTTSKKGKESTESIGHLHNTITQLNNAISSLIKTEIEINLYFVQKAYRELTKYIDTTGNSNPWFKDLRDHFLTQPFRFFKYTFMVSWAAYMRGLCDFGVFQSGTKMFMEIYNMFTLGGREERSEGNYAIKSPYTILKGSIDLQLATASKSMEKKLLPQFGQEENNQGELNLNQGNDLFNFKTRPSDGNIDSSVAKERIEGMNLEGTEKLLKSIGMLHEYDAINKKFFKEFNDDLELAQKVFLLIDKNCITESWWRKSSEDKVREKLKTYYSENEKIGKLTSAQICAAIEIMQKKQELDIRCTHHIKQLESGWQQQTSGFHVANTLCNFPFGPEFGALILGGALDNLYQSGKKQGFFDPLFLIGRRLHYFLMGEVFHNTEDLSQSLEEDSGTLFPYGIDHPTFDFLDQQGVLKWFKDIVSLIDQSCSNNTFIEHDRISKSIGLFGPSGSGKTFLARAFAKSIRAVVEKYKTNIKVDFIPIDPKHFNGIISDGKETKIDIINELELLLEEVKLKGGFYIVHLDEFHLFFTKDGKINQEKLADLLKFFNDLFVKQKYNKKIGGMYVVCSTNKPEFIPHEFFDNGDRIGEVVEIRYPNGKEIVTILKTQLEKNNTLIEHLDFDYFERLFEGSYLTYGNILKIADKALANARIHNKLLDNEVLYYAMNDVVRKIVLNKNDVLNNFDITSSYYNGIVSYYASLAAIAINFDHVKNNFYELDMVTILPIKQGYTPQHIDRLYTKPAIQSIKMGGDFYIKKNIDNFINTDMIALEIVKGISSIVYLDQQELAKVNVTTQLSNIYEILFIYYASQVKNAKLSKGLTMSEEARKTGQDIKIFTFNDVYSDEATNKKITTVLNECQKAIQVFYSYSEVKEFVKVVSDLLLEKKIVTRKDILKNDICKNLLENINNKFDELIQSIKTSLLIN